MTDKYLENFTKWGSSILLALYVTGFLVWNYYLSKFGFFEAELLQTRFISAGLSALILPFIILYISKRLRDWVKQKGLLFNVVIYFVWLFIFITYIFPILPQKLGGARPYVSSIIASKDSLSNFRTMGIDIAEAPKNENPVETSKVCKIYDNKDYILLGMIFRPTQIDSAINVKPNRVVILDKKQLYGFSVLPRHHSEVSYQMVCDTIRITYGINLSLEYSYYREADFLNRLINRINK